MHQAQRQRGVRIEPAGGDGQALGFGKSQALDQVGSDLRRHQAERCFRQAEAGRGMGQRDIRGTGEAEAATHHRALDDGHHGQRSTGKRRTQPAEARVDVGQGIVVLFLLIPRRRHVLEVGAGTEMPAGSAQHHDARHAVGLGGSQRREQFIDHGQRHGVARLRPVQRQVQYAALAARQHGCLIAHVSRRAAGCLRAWR